MKQFCMPSLIGPLYLVASEKGLQGIYWDEQPIPMARDLTEQEEPVKHLAQAIRELTEYFKGERKQFAVALDLKGTEFQKRVWAKLAQIPYGTTNSYREIACQIQRDKAVRAVGSANGKNPVCIIVPCHRVIAANGTLGGYSGGLDIKSKLLELERNHT